MRHHTIRFNVFIFLYSSTMAASEETMFHLKQQFQQNTSDLQSYLSDLDDWTKDMAKKDASCTRNQRSGYLAGRVSTMPVGSIGRGGGSSSLATENPLAQNKVAAAAVHMARIFFMDIIPVVTRFSIDRGRYPNNLIAIVGQPT